MPEHLPGAASTSLRALLNGPQRPAEILAAFRQAVYLQVTSDCADGCAREDDVVAVLTLDALRLPGSVVLPAATGARPRNLRPTPGDDALAMVGGGRISLPGLTVVVARWWRPRRAHALPRNAQVRRRTVALTALVPPLPTKLAAPVRALTLALRHGHSDVARIAARRLVGLGPGLTPAGDDVLAGLLLTLNAGPTRAHSLGVELATAVVADAADRTTSLSASLLRQAARGEAVPEVIDLVDRLAADAITAGPDMAASLRKLLSVGSSSGNALAHGVLLGARTIAGSAHARGLPSVEVA